VFIGAGGWAYFRGPWRGNLEAYTRAFNFVEVNSTFYSYPDIRLVRSWRKRVPESFQFSVRSHNDLTHRYKLRPVDEAFNAYYRMVDVCNALDAKILHLLTPAGERLDNQGLREIAEFLSSVDSDEPRIAWEIRGQRAQDEWEKLTRIMQDHNIVHCVDLSAERPKVQSDIMYARLFGKGAHNLYQFDDNELHKINAEVEKQSKRSYLVFHGGRMYEDAARLKTYRETGEFPRARGPTGAESLMRILREDAVFPTTRSELTREQGWKVIDLTDDERAHASLLLDKLPNRTYLDLADIRQTLANVHAG
jgi:uncharacterized protein YecE (DUF72 family)